MGRDAYIYALSDPRDDVPSYIGRTIDPGARLAQHLRAVGKSPKAQWVRSVLSEGQEPCMEILERCRRGDAGRREQWWIRFGFEAGWPLTNVTAGSDEPGARRTVEAMFDALVHLAGEDPDSFRNLTDEEKWGAICNAVNGTMLEVIEQHANGQFVRSFEAAMCPDWQRPRQLEEMHETMPQWLEDMRTDFNRYANHSQEEGRRMARVISGWWVGQLQKIQKQSPGHLGWGPNESNARAHKRAEPNTWRAVRSAITLR